MNPQIVIISVKACAVIGIFSFGYMTSDFLDKNKPVNVTVEYKGFDCPVPIMTDEEAAELLEGE